MIVGVVAVLSLLFLIASFGVGFILDMIVYVIARMFKNSLTSFNRFLIRFGWAVSGITGIIAVVWIASYYSGAWTVLMIVPVVMSLIGAVVSSFVIRALQRHGYSMFQ